MHAICSILHIGVGGLGGPRYRFVGGVSCDGGVDVVVPGFVVEGVYGLRVLVSERVGAVHTMRGGSWGM